MGTHPKGPASLLESKVSLRDHIKADLPFLFKVLSVAKALSIQAHPDKQLAERLHADRPDVYKDPNHKPEMACAVTQFQCLCGFRPPQQIARFLETVPGSRVLCGCPHLVSSHGCLRQSSVLSSQMKWRRASRQLCELRKRRS